MNFDISHNNQYALVVSNVEKLDINASSELKSELVMLNKNGINSIVLDLSKTLYCDSSGLSSILVANRLCKDSSGQFILCGLNAKILKLIEISQLDKVLNITETAQKAQEIFVVKNDI
ncbi:MAG: STAS domain-containing protein [Bacteroidota bacterium]